MKNEKEMSTIERVLQKLKKADPKAYSKLCKTMGMFDKKELENVFRNFEQNKDNKNFSSDLLRTKRLFGKVKSLRIFDSTLKVDSMCLGGESFRFSVNLDENSVGENGKVLICKYDEGWSDYDGLNINSSREFYDDSGLSNDPSQSQPGQ